MVDFDQVANFNRAFQYYGKKFWKRNAIEINKVSMDKLYNSWIEFFKSVA